MAEDVFRVVAGPDEGASFALKGAEALIGRDPDAVAILLTDPSVSRRHARAFIEGGLLLVEDAGSSAGTMLNGAPVERRSPLRQGDTITLGATELEVLRTPTPAQTMVAQAVVLSPEAELETEPEPPSAPEPEAPVEPVEQEPPAPPPPPHAAENEETAEENVDRAPVEEDESSTVDVGDSESAQMTAEADDDAVVAEPQVEAEDDGAYDTFDAVESVEDEAASASEESSAQEQPEVWVPPLEREATSEEPSGLVVEEPSEPEFDPEAYATYASTSIPEDDDVSPAPAEHATEPPADAPPPAPPPPAAPSPQAAPDPGAPPPSAPPPPTPPQAAEPQEGAPPPPPPPAPAPDESPSPDESEGEKKGRWWSRRRKRD